MTTEHDCPRCGSPDVFILRDNHHVCSKCSHNWGRVDAEGNPITNPTFIAGMDKSAIAAYLTPEILDRIRRSVFSPLIVRWTFGETVEQVRYIPIEPTSKQPREESTDE